MNRVELEKKLANDELLSVYVNGVKKYYVDSEKLSSDRSYKNITNIFGIYKGAKEKYVFLITDNERGVADYIKIFNTEEEACDALYVKIARLKRIHEKGL